jgi:hypothetical protein
MQWLEPSHVDAVRHLREVARTIIAVQRDNGAAEGSLLDECDKHLEFSQQAAGWGSAAPDHASVASHE